MKISTLVGIGPWLLTGGVILGLADCGSSSSGAGSSGSGNNGSGSSSSGESSAGSAASGTTGGGTGSATASGGSGSTVSGAGSSDDAGGDDGGTTITPDGGFVSTEGGATSSVGGNCKVADITPCSTFTTVTGETIQLGPYGAQMDVNVGKGFENALTAADKPDSGTCAPFVKLFDQSPTLSNQLLVTTMNGITVDFTLYSAYRPAVWPSGPVPVITWGNGTCAQPEGYGALLRYVASFGYFVIAANMREVSSDSPAPMINALNYAEAANKDSTSPYYGKLDMTRVGAMGHSQGGAATASAANSDSRIQYVVDFNAADSNINKPYLAFSGDHDITLWTAAQMATAINGSSQPAAYLYYHNPLNTNPDGGAASENLVGHLVLMLQPERVEGPATNWFEMWFRNDGGTTSPGAIAKAQFVATDDGGCGLCTQIVDPENDMEPADYVYGHNSNLK